MPVMSSSSGSEVDTENSSREVITKSALGKSGLIVSPLGVGCAGLSGLHGPMDLDEAKSAIKYAVSRGVNFIDTAPFYNDRSSEVHLGEIFQTMNRDDFCVATKVGRYMDLVAQQESFDYSASKTKNSVLESLQCMKLNHIDLIQIHDVEFAPSLEYLLTETIPCLVELKRQGFVHSIGITGYSTKHLRRVVEACPQHIDTVMSYYRHSLYDDSLLKDLPFFKSRNIGVINASPLAIGLLTNRGTTPEWNPASEELRAACKEAAEYCCNNRTDLARLSLRYSYTTEDLNMTLWSSRRLANMKSNISHAITPLSTQEETTLDAVRNKILLPVRNHHWEDKIHAYHNFWDINE